MPSLQVKLSDFDFASEVFLQVEHRIKVSKLRLG